jgi:hypothetical protein
VDIAAFVVSVVSAIGTAFGILYTRRSASSDRISAIADQSALKVAKEQLAIEQARRYKEMEERGESALEGRMVASPDDDGTGRARLEIQLMNAVELTSMVVIFRAGCPVNPYAATRVMSENRRPFPDGGNTVIKMGFPAHWRVHIVGDLEPFTLEVMARRDYGKSWDSLRVRVTFDDWTSPAAPRRSIPVQVRRSIRSWIRLPLGGRARKAIGTGVVPHVPRQPRGHVGPPAQTMAREPSPSPPGGSGVDLHRNRIAARAAHCEPPDGASGSRSSGGAAPSGMATVRRPQAAGCAS